MISKADFVKETLMISVGT